MITSFADWCHEHFDASLGDRERFFLWMGLGALPGAFLAGACADRLGKRRTVAISLVGSLVLTPLLLVADSFAMFIAVAVSVSAVAAMRQGPFAAILTGLGPDRLRGSLVGLNSAASGIGLATGTWLGGVLYGWRKFDGAVWGGVAILVVACCIFLAGVFEPRARAAEESIERNGVEESRS